MDCSLVKRAPGEANTEEELDLAIRQIVSRAVVPDGVVDLFAAAGLKKPDISVLSEEFLAEVRGMPQRNLAVELLRKLLSGEIRRYRNRAVDTAKELAFYDALETNDSAVKVLGEPTLRTIAQGLVRTVRANVTVDRTVRENVRVQLRVLSELWAAA